MIFAAYAFFQIRKVDIAPAGFHHLPCHRNFDAQELVPFSILTGARLEETGKTGYL